MGIEAVVEADAFGKPLNAAVRRLGEYSTSGGSGQQGALASRSESAPDLPDARGVNGSNPFILNGLRRAVNEPNLA